MRIGVPKEIKEDEYRVGLTRASARELVEVAEAGHMSPMEKPEVVNAAIGEYLAQLR